MKSAEVSNKQSSTASKGHFFKKGNAESFFSGPGEKTDSFFNINAIQPSLSIGRSDDPFEKEADDVAGQVVKGFDQVNIAKGNVAGMGLQPILIQPWPITKQISRKQQYSNLQANIQTKCSHCEEEEKKMQQKSSDIQFSGEGMPVAQGIENKIDSLKGGGQSMDGNVKSFMENSFFADFSGVRIHQHSDAIQMNQQLNAHAFTVGNDIFFNEGKFRPNEKAGAGLLAHELSHTIQQGTSAQRQKINNNSMTGELMGGHNIDTNISFGSLDKGKNIDKKEIQKKGTGLKIQRCPNDPTKNRTVRYRQYGGTGFSPESGGGSCPAYCACKNDENGNPVTGGDARYSPRPKNGRCPPGLIIVWNGSSIVSETPLEITPCRPGEDRGCL